MSEAVELLYLTPELEGIGGQLRTTPDDFFVEEIPAYLPSGEGEHLYLWIEKVERTTSDLVSSLAKALELRQGDLGYAGMKDKYARTRQWISLPPGTNREVLAALELPGVNILDQKLHTNKLKTGHLRGNRFILRVRHLNGPADEALERARVILAALGERGGMPNYYAEQRFGRDGTNAAVGRALVTKTPHPMAHKARGKRKRLYISAYQSHLFNQYLVKRVGDRCLAQVVEGDLLQKTDSGGVFYSEDLDDENVRLSQGAIHVTGPMFGHKMRQPEAGTASYAREKAVLDEEGIALDSFRHLGKIAQGTRRPLAVHLDDARAEAFEDGLKLHFALPSGSYATALMREIMKPQ